MGLVAVELIMAIEDEFQIALSDKEAIKCATPTLLTDLVYAKLQQSDSEVCASMHGFYLVRKVLSDQLDLSRESIRPESQLAELLTKNNRLISWPKLLFTLVNGQTIYAPLEKPLWIKLAIFISSLLVFGIALSLTDSLILSLLVGCFNSMILSTASLSFQTELPKKFRTVNDLIPLINTLDSKIWQYEQVYNRVKILVAEQLGVKAEKVLADSHFIKDLGMT